MDDYIKLEALTAENLEQYMTVFEVKTKEYGRQTVVAVDDLQYLPTADVVEVRHGEWIYQGYGCWGCTACRTNTDFNTVFDPLKDLGLCYCPHCGAKMDGKGEGE